ncbi:MAG: winged helix-turn-helix domain-containing protein, partial [Spirochaetaceae bacterium]|nr:winged helix-turn-helix domain-containing protein [Spirochaetaceae bacterium]
MIDELTPYYQERIRWLAPLQRKIVEHLCSRARTTPVKDIAKALFATHQTIASQLKALREIGYVESHARGRESLYELSEPLMRLCVEVKENQQRKPLRLIVDFLRVWYDADKLEGHLAALSSEAPEYAYLVRALELVRTQTISPRVEYLLDDLDRTDPKKPSPERLQCLRELVGERGTEEDWLNLIHALIVNQEWAETLATIQKAGEAKVVASDMGQLVLNVSASSTLLRLGRIGDTTAHLSRIIDNPKTPIEACLPALFIRGWSFFLLGNIDSAQTDFDALINRPDCTLNDRVEAQVFRCVLLTA